MEVETHIRAPHRGMACWMTVFAMGMLLAAASLRGQGPDEQAMVAPGEVVPVDTASEPEDPSLIAAIPEIDVPIPPPNRMVRFDRKFSRIIEKAAVPHEVDPAMIKAIILAESSYDPKAVSRRGALGLMQLMPKTAESLGVEDSLDPEHNINGGVRYFKQLLDHFDGDPALALAAYNAGIGRVQRHDGIPPYRATQIYIRKVLTYFDYFKGNLETTEKG